MRTLYLKQTTVNEIDENWGFKTYFNFSQSPFYIQCTKQGVINWDKASVYTNDMLKNIKRTVVIV